MLEKYTIDGFENIQYSDFCALKHIEEKLNRLFELYGYYPVAIPTFEAYDLYVSEEAIPNDDLFKLVNHHGRVLALRPDATLPITRMAALNHHDPKKIIKFFYRTNIYRNFSSPEIIKKELTQMGIEYFGNDAPECDGEVIALAVMALLENGIKDVHIDLGHVGFINFLMDELRLEETQRKRLIRLIENKNTADIEQYLENTKIDPAMRERILALPKLYGHPRTVFEKMRTLCVNAKMEAVVEQLKGIYRHLDTIGLSKYLSFDLGFTNQMNYYSDIIFKGYINNWGEPVLSGGRYNHLSEKFGLSRPACGFAIDLVKMMEYMESNELLPDHEKEKVVLIYAPEKKAESFKIATALRAKDIPTEMYVQTRKHPEEQIRVFEDSMFFPKEKTRYYYLNMKGAYRFNGKTFSSTDIYKEEDITK